MGHSRGSRARAEPPEDSERCVEDGLRRPPSGHRGPRLSPASAHDVFQSAALRAGFEIAGNFAGDRLPAIPSRAAASSAAMSRLAARSGEARRPRLSQEGQVRARSCRHSRNAGSSLIVRPSRPESHRDAARCWNCCTTAVRCSFRKPRAARHAPSINASGYWLVGVIGRRVAIASTASRRPANRDTRARHPPRSNHPATAREPPGAAVNGAAAETRRGGRNHRPTPSDCPGSLCIGNAWDTATSAGIRCPHRCSGPTAGTGVPAAAISDTAIKPATARKGRGIVSF